MILSIFNRTSTLAITGLIRSSYDNFNSSLERLSSGLLINSASDGPAQLVISERLRAQIGSLNQELENISAMVGKYKTASSYLGDLRSRLTDVRSLALAASNEGVNDEFAQEAYDMAATLTVESFNNLAQSASYNGHTLFDGSEFALANIPELTGVDLSSAATAQESIEIIDEAIAEVDAAHVEVGAAQKYDLESRRSSLEVTRQNLISAESQIRDLDFAREYSTMIAEKIKLQVGLSLLNQDFLNGAMILKLL